MDPRSGISRGAALILAVGLVAGCASQRVTTSSPDWRTSDDLVPPPDIARAGFFKFGTPNDGLNVGTLGGAVTATIPLVGWTGIDGDGGAWASGPAGGVVLYGDGREVHAVDVSSGADALVLVTPAEVRDGVLDPDGAEAFLVYQDCCLGAEVWRVPLDGSRPAERLIAPAPRPVTLIDAILAAKIRLRTQLAISSDGNTLTLLECETGCRLQVYDVASGGTALVDPWRGPAEMVAVHGSLFVGRDQSVDLRTGQEAEGGGNSALDCQDRPILVNGVNVLDPATGEHRVVPIPADTEIIPATSLDIVGIQGVELPRCWVLAVEHFPGPPGQMACDGRYVAMHVDTGELEALGVLGPAPFCG